MALILAGKLQLPAEEVKDLAADIVEELKSMERFADAAYVCLDYLEDHEGSIRLLTDARQWREALRLSHRFRREDLIDSVIAPAAASVVSSFLETFNTNADNIAKYRARLEEVRKKRQAMEEAVGQTGADVEGEEGASTVAGLSIYTDRTHLPKSLNSSSAALTVGGKKPKQKQRNKKKLKIKQGSPEEEAALVEHLHQLQPDTHVLEEVSQLLEFLIYMGFCEDAQKLQEALDSLLKRHNSALVQSRLSPKSDVTAITWKLDILRSAA